MFKKLKRWWERIQNQSIFKLRQEIKQLKHKVHRKDGYIIEITNKADENCVHYEFEIQDLKDYNVLESKHQTDRINKQSREIVDINIEMDRLKEYYDDLNRRFEWEKHNSKTKQQENLKIISKLEGRIKAYELQLGVFK